MKMRLTKRKIESLEFDPDGPSQQVEWDDRLPNFGVRINPGGSKSFIIRYRNEHRCRRLLTIGRFGRMTLQQAHIKAMEKFAEVDDGADPVARKLEKRNAETVDEFADAYVDNYAKARKIDVGARRTPPGTPCAPEVGKPQGRFHHSPRRRRTPPPYRNREGPRGGGQPDIGADTEDVQLGAL